MSEMTPLQKRCIELLPVIQGGAQGKVIQLKFIGDWKDKNPDSTTFDGIATSYRIKPEPKYRPFTQAEGLKHIGRNISHKGFPVGFTKNIRGVGVDGFVCKTVGHVEWSDMPFAFLVENYTFDDGSPCGVLES